MKRISLAKNSFPLKKKIQLELYRLYKHNQARLHPLLYIMWECTLRCNLSCRHCGSDCTKETTVPDMPLSDFLKVLDSAAAVCDPSKTMVGLTGGEPLLRTDLEEAGIEITKRGFSWGFVTNGFALSSERFNSLLRAGLRSLSISLDGTKEDHNWLRRNSQSFDKTAAAVKTAAEFSAKNPKQLLFDVITCVNQQNFSHLQSIKEMLIGLGVQHWRIFTIFPSGRAKNDEQLSLSSLQFEQVLQFIKQTRKEGRIHVQYSCEGFLGPYEGEVRGELFFCKAGINFASVLCDGSISACPSIRSKEFSQGSIYTDSFIDVWENRFGIMRNRKWTRTGSCAKCSYWRYCEGSGIHLHQSKTDEPMLCSLSFLSDNKED